MHGCPRPMCVCLPRFHWLYALAHHLYYSMRHTLIPTSPMMPRSQVLISCTNAPPPSFYFTTGLRSKAHEPRILFLARPLLIPKTTGLLIARRCCTSPLKASLNYCGLQYSARPEMPQHLPAQRGPIHRAHSNYFLLRQV